MLELQSITKTIGTFTLSDVSLQINDGEYFVILGPSGVGKSVLIEIIAGLIKPDKGRIFHNGRDITFEPPQTRGFALMYQDYALFPHLSVKGNIAYGLKTAGRNSEQTSSRVSAIAEMLGIEQLLNRRPTTLSGGEQQRVALARALAVEPELLLLDEPLSALDTNTRLRLRRQLKQINSRLNTSILHVTHDPEEAMTLADRICVMLDNKIRQTATPQELFRSPSDHKVADFLGIRNILTVSGVQNGMCKVNGEKIHASCADDSTRHIWIKPEEILLSTKPFDSSARNQFSCRVSELDRKDSLLAIHLTTGGGLTLTALITYASFKKLAIKTGSQVYATFKSSATHAF